MLDKKAQKSLLENAAEVNQEILDVCKANVKEYNDMLTSFTDLTTKVTDENAKALHIETFGKEARQSLNIKTLLDLPDMKKDAIDKVIEIMKDMEAADEKVAKTIKIAAAVTAATSASTAPVIPKPTFTAYYKSDFDVTYWSQPGVFSVVLPIFKEDDLTNLVLTFNTSTKEITSENMSDDDVTNNLGTEVARTHTYQDEIDAIEKTDKYKEWENAESYFKSEREINDQMETDKTNALAKITKLKTLLADKEAAFAIANSTSDATQQAELKAEIDEIYTSLPAEQLKVDQKTISDGFKTDLKRAEDNNEDWFATLLANAKDFDKTRLFKDNETKKVFTMGRNGKDLNPLSEKRASPLWFISSSINGPLKTDFLKDKKVKKVIEDKISTGAKFYNIETGEQFTTFANFLNFSKPGSA
jgi:hypothetical protein